MEFNQINDDAEMRLLASLPLYTDGLPVYSPKLLDIADINESIYHLYASICINENLDNSYLPYENKYENIVAYSGDILECFILALKFITHKEFQRVEYGGKVFFVTDGATLHHENFNDFVELIKFSNGFEKKQGNNNKRNLELDNKIEEAKRRINERLKKKDKKDDNIRLMDLISVLAAKHHNLNIMNIWDLTIYQFNDQFKQMQLIENFEIGIRQLLAGAKEKDVKLEHYIKRK